MTILSIDHKIFGNGKGCSSPHFDQRFYWLSGELYTFHAWLGAQLFSCQWQHPKPQEERILSGYKFRPFSSKRRCVRVYVSWRWVDLPADLEDAHASLAEMRNKLGCHD